MGGCIAPWSVSAAKLIVSSLHGRVYRIRNWCDNPADGFLPTWEGVSGKSEHMLTPEGFPPYMGGCIGYGQTDFVRMLVSSLHGRVYRTVSMILMITVKFPPYMGECIVGSIRRMESEQVSSLHGRVYRNYA